MGRTVGHCWQNRLWPDTASECIRTGSDITSMMKRNRNICMLSSRHWCWPYGTSCIPLQCIRWRSTWRWEEWRTYSYFISIRYLHLLRLVSFQVVLNEGAEKIYQQLSKKYNCEYDDRGNIGKRYRRQCDEIGNNRSVLLMTLSLKMTELLLYVTAIPWSRYVLQDWWTWCIFRW